MNILFIYLGIVMIISAIGRFFLKKERIEEMTLLNLPKHFDVVYYFQFIVGIVLLFFPLFVKKVFLILLLFFLGICCGLIIYYHPTLLKKYADIFTIQPSFLSLFLNITYIIIIISLLYT